MKNKEEIRMMRKTNMRIFPAYKRLAWDYLFFYTIDFLFLTQIKGISASDFMLKSTFYAFFNVILQIPANIIVEFLGRKNSIILGNILNCLYMLIIMMSTNLRNLVCAEFFGALATAIKYVAEPSLLNASIPPSRYKSNIFAKINSKGAFEYYIINAVSKVIGGILFAVNGYLPIIMSLIVLIISTILSIGFIEPVTRKSKKSKTAMYITQIKEVKQGFSFVLKSERLKALILCSSLIYTLLSILLTYYVSLEQDIGLSSVTIGVIAAIAGLISAYASKCQNEVNKKLKNRTLFVNAMLISISTIMSGIFGLGVQKNIIFLVLLIVSIIIYDFALGLYYTIIDRYLRNFSNEKIDTKIFAAYNLFRNAFRCVGGIFASFLLEKTITAYCMIIIGIIFTIIYILMEKYMKTRVGLKPEEYSDEEIKYDELKKLQ